jgi:hypothetical protein
VCGADDGGMAGADVSGAAEVAGAGAGGNTGAGQGRQGVLLLPALTRSRAGAAGGERE